MTQTKLETAGEATLTAPVRTLPEVTETPAPPVAAGPGNVEPVIVVEQPAEQPQKKRKSAARKAGLFILFVLGATMAWHVATDLLVPSSSTGSVTALTALIAPRVAGQVSQVLVADNQFVEAGTPLFTLDASPFDLAVRQAEANLAQVTQTVGAGVISLASVEAKVNQAQTALDGTRGTTERTINLFERGLTSQASVDAANSQLASAEAGLASAKAELDSAILRAGADGVANPQVETAQVQVEQAHLNRSFATVVAPTSGVVTNLKLAPGQFVNAGTPALTFIESDSLWVVVDMRENQLANVKVGDEARVLFDAVPGKTFDGRVRGIAWGIDPGRTAANGLPQNQAMNRWFEPARTIPVHIELAETQQWPSNVRVGSMASALVFAGDRNSPISAVASFMQTVSSYVSYLY
ncbi:HlyD family secretion protein [Devosia sp. 2618]|uniref:HlyD family secretion protein n=1 Tax=Devosia sp. 2618 TaxID=3156454 RepID=UPI00339AF05F